MPIPTPNKDETKKDFIARCMSDEVMVSEYPDEKQRMAICSTQHAKETKSKHREVERMIIKRGVDMKVDSNKIGGYAARFNELSENLGGYQEIIRPSAFKKTLGENADVRCLIDHESRYVLGRTEAGTLRLWTDANGLRFECDMPDTSYAKDLQASIGRGDINQCSFGFSISKGGDKWNSTNTLREVLECRLFDVSVVTYPAYPQTSVSLRSWFTNRGIDYDKIMNLIYFDVKKDSLDEETRELITKVISEFKEFLPETIDQTEKDKIVVKEPENIDIVGIAARKARTLYEVLKLRS